MILLCLNIPTEVLLLVSYNEWRHLVFVDLKTHFDIRPFQATIKIESGVGETIEKEEWRGDLVANVFYPKGKPQSKDWFML